MGGRGFTAWIVAATLLLAGAAHADEPVTLRFAIPGSGTFSPTWGVMWQPWIAKVEADSDGSLRLQPFFNGLADMFNVYDRIVSGAADLGAGIQGAIGGKFPGSSVVELPSDIGGEEGAGAFWTLDQTGLIAKEYSAVKPLALFVYPQSFASAAKPIAALGDIKGLRIATLTKADAEVAQRLGAAPLSTSPTEVYEMLQRHGADGVIIGWLGLVGFKLAEVTRYHITTGLGSGGGFLLMNSEAYRKLPPKARAAIDKNSGLAASMLLGAALDKIYAGAQAAVRAMPGHVIAPLPPEEEARYRQEIVQPLINDWVAKTPNGAAILAAYRGTVAQERAATK